MRSGASAERISNGSRSGEYIPGTEFRAEVDPADDLKAAAASLGNIPGPTRLSTLTSFLRKHK